MRTVDKLKDLIEQATKERSHYYVKAVAEEAIEEIEELNVLIDNWMKCAEEWMHECDVLKAKYEPKVAVIND